MANDILDKILVKLINDCADKVLAELVQESEESDFDPIHMDAPGGAPGAGATAMATQDVTPVSATDGSALTTPADPTAHVALSWVPHRCPCPGSLVAKGQQGGAGCWNPGKHTNDLERA